MSSNRFSGVGKFAPGLLVALLAGFSFGAPDSSGPDWTNRARIAAYGLTAGNATEIARRAHAEHVLGIEVDNDITGRYESFLNPDAKLQAIKTMAAKAHESGNYAFVYIAGTECITANGNRSVHTLAKDHPDWLQRKLTGEPAIFGGGSAFWIKPGDEDVWVSPYATKWRELYMVRVRQIAATGIDGIYVDIPYWMTHFDGWENSWASFDNFTVSAFRQQTGLDAKTAIKLGDFSDPGFRQWVSFRIQTFTDFLAEIAKAAKSVNPAIKIIPEIYPGIEQEAARVGADVYSLYPVVDAIAHEYEFGAGDHMASSRTPFDWFAYQVGMHSFRAFAQGKATWILNYSWDGDKNVDSRESMKNLAMSELMAGANFWDAPGHSMAGSNDLSTRQTIFSWVEANEKTFYAPRTAIHPVGVYFSPETRNFYPEQFVSSYRGILILLMQKHLEFQIVTPRTLAEFKGDSLVLPNVRILTSTEKDTLQTYVASGRQLVITGTDVTQLGKASGIARFSDCPGESYIARLEKDFEHASPNLQEAFLSSLHPHSAISISAAPMLATSIALVDGDIQIFFANFAGLKGARNPVQIPQTGVRVTIATKTTGKAFVLPFLGHEQELDPQQGNGALTFTLPAISKGAVFRYHPANN